MLVSLVSNNRMQVKYTEHVVITILSNKRMNGNYSLYLFHVGDFEFDGLLKAFLLGKQVAKTVHIHHLAGNQLKMK